MRRWVALEGPRPGESLRVLFSTGHASHTTLPHYFREYHGPLAILGAMYTASPAVGAGFDLAILEASATHAQSLAEARGTPPQAGRKAATP